MEMEGGVFILLYPKAICRMGVEVVASSVRRGESLDCTDPSEATFSLQVNLDMEKIMESLGEISNKKTDW